MTQALADPAVTPRSRCDRVSHEIAAAVLVTLGIVRGQLLAEAPDLGHVAEQARSAWSRHAPLWLRVAVPAIRQAFALGSVEGLTESELRTLAADYAGILGDYVNQTSADALVEGLDRQLAKRWSEKLAWQRAASAYGLDRREMRAWVDGVMLGSDAGQADPVPATARLLVDKALIRRADKIGQSESWTAGQTGQALAWLMLQRTGRLPAGARREWDTSETDRVCTHCQPMDRKRVALDKPFVLPDGRKLWAPQAHPGCECRVRLWTPAAPGAVIRKTAADPTVAGLAVRARDTGRVLMLQRANDPKDPAGGMWEFPGGHLENGEDPLTGATREWQEEVHRKVPAGKPGGQWRHGIYQGHVLVIPRESEVQPHKRGRVVNPDDPDGDAVEAIAWWDPAQLRGNPAVRPELRLTLPKVHRALGDVGKRYDPNEPRDSHGRWTDEPGGRTQVKQAERHPEVDAILDELHAGPVTESPYGPAPSSPYSSSGSPYSSSSPYAAKSPYSTESPYSAESPYASPARPRRRHITRHTLVVIPPGKAKPAQDTHFMDTADLFDAIGWKRENLGIGDPVDFDEANVELPHDSLHAERLPNAWHAIPPPIDYADEDQNQEDRLATHLWNRVLVAAKPIWNQSLERADRIVPKLDADDLSSIARTAGYSDEEPPDEMRARILRAVNKSDDVDNSLSDSYADYVTFVKPSLAGDARDLDLALDDALGDASGTRELFDEPPQVFAFPNGHHPETKTDDEHGVVYPEGSYYVNGLIYHSRLRDTPHGVAPQVFGMQEVQLKPLPDED